MASVVKISVTLVGDHERISRIADLLCSVKAAIPDYDLQGHADIDEIADHLKAMLHTEAK